jgi:hypothetical protein
MRPLHDLDEVAQEQEALALLRSISIAPAPTLVALTQRRVREQALRLHEVQVRRWGLAVSGVIAGSMTMASSVSVWRVLADVGWLSVPWIWAPVVLGAWFLPGVLAGALAWAAVGLPQASTPIWGTTEAKGVVTQ